MVIIILPSIVWPMFRLDAAIFSFEDLSSGSMLLLFFSFFLQNIGCYNSWPILRLGAAFFIPVVFCFVPLLPLDSGSMLQNKNWRKFFVWRPKYRVDAGIFGCCNFLFDNLLFDPNTGWVLQCFIFLFMLNIGYCCIISTIFSLDAAFFVFET